MQFIKVCNVISTNLQEKITIFLKILQLFNYRVVLFVLFQNNGSAKVI